jgi:hypothetical protein
MTAGSFWRCPRCGSGQHGTHRFCSDCGGPAPVFQQKAGSSGASGCLAGCLGTVFVLGLLGMLVSLVMSSCIYQMSQPASHTARVTAVSWERIVEIERNDLRQKEGTKAEIPAGAVDIKRKGQTEIYTYKVREWAVDRTLRASGDSQDDIRWPVDTKTAEGGLEPDQNERETHREKYYVTMRYDAQTFRFVVKDLGRFHKFKLGTTHVITPVEGRVIIDNEAYNYQ